MNQEKKLFRIFNVRGIEYESERIHTIVCRYTTEEEIKKEIQLLNDNYPNFSKEKDYWDYYGFEEIQILEKGDMGKNHIGISNVKEIHLQSLKNAINNCFDVWFKGAYNRLKTLKKEKNVEALKDKVALLYGNYLINGLERDELFSIIKEQKKEGKINSDVWFLDQ